MPNKRTYGGGWPNTGLSGDGAQGGPGAARGRGGFGAKDALKDPNIEAAVPVKAGTKARFFIIRSQKHDYLAVSVPRWRRLCRRLCRRWSAPRGW